MIALGLLLLCAVLVCVAMARARGESAGRATGIVSDSLIPTEAQPSPAPIDKLEPIDVDALAYPVGCLHIDGPTDAEIADALIRVTR